MNTHELAQRRPMRASLRHLHMPSRFAVASAALMATYVLLSLGGCTARAGGDELAFLRGGELWSAQSDGAGMRQLAGSGIVGYSWSPDHHQLVARRATAGAGTVPAPDARGNIIAVSINGGFGLQLTPDDSGVTRSDAWWNPGGNRLIYRERDAAGQGPLLYIVSQSDQPSGIARKPVPQAAALPVLSADGRRVAAIDDAGNVLVGEPGKPLDVVATRAVVTMPASATALGRPAHLLWQPHHDALLYPVANGSAGSLALVLTSLGGGSREVGRFDGLLDAAFSPEGSHLLVRTAREFQVRALDASAPAIFTWPARDPDALAWWSPDGKLLLMRDADGVWLVDPAQQTVTALLKSSAAGTQDTAPAHTSWTPASGSPWNADGSRIVFAAPAGATWRGQALGSSGLYVASIAGEAAPTRIDDHQDREPSWGYADPSTVLLRGV